MRTGSRHPCAAATVILLLFLGAACTGSAREEAYQKAERFWQRKMFGLAAQGYEQYALQFPGDRRASQALYKAGFISAYYLNDYPRAIELFQTLVSLYPECPYQLQAHLNMADIYGTHLRQFARAIAEYRRVIELEKRKGRDVSEYHYRIGRLYFQLGDARRALQVYERICTEMPRGRYAAGAAYQIGFLHYLRDDLEAAEKSFRYLVRHYPDSEWDFDGRVYLFRCLKKERRDKEAARVLKEIRDRYPARSKALDGIGGRGRRRRVG